MGFPVESCKKAVYFTKNAGIEPATNWLMEHITDADFNEPFVIPGTGRSQAAFVPNESGLEMLMGMGFNRHQATKALKETDNNTERAVDYIFSHQDELDISAMETDQPAPEVANRGYRDGPGSEYIARFLGIFNDLFLLYRIQTGRLHITHGQFIASRPLCLSYFEERTMDHFQRQ
jgi:ubiquitin carboxyl-terminal hydrolase 5/13